jgi:hypothetical protein
MQTIIVEILTVAASALTAGIAGMNLLRLKKSVDSGSITVVNKKNGKTATLPRNYSPAAVEQLLEVTA